MRTIYDPFKELAKPHSVVTIHNVLLVDVQPGEGGFEKLVVERNEERHELLSGGRWNEEWSRRDVGRHGHLVPATPIASGLPPGSCYFRPYVDPSLRRVPELDGADGAGWLCDTRPQGFIAPHGLLPGANGDFVVDRTIEVMVKVPPEFVRECERVQLTPQQVLQGFMADAAGIQNYVNCPRADGFGSNGSDERDMADAWLERAYGHGAVDLDALEAQAYKAEQRQFERDDFGDLLSEYESYGGNAADLVSAVQALIGQQQQKAEGAT